MPLDAKFRACWVCVTARNEDFGLQAFGVLGFRLSETADYNTMKPSDAKC